jgi:c-di-GMP-binding flagellar brake protein YcgR
MADIKLEVNKRLDVIWNDKIYRSSVQDLSDDYLAIATPITAGLYLPLHKGDTFLAHYYIDDKELYEFVGNVVTRRIEEKVQLIILEYPKNLKLVQRREYVRVDINHPVKYVKSTVISDLKNVDEVFEMSKANSGLLLDISGGGVRIRTLEKMERGNFITVDMELLGRSIRVNGKIVRVIQDETGNFVSGVSFLDISERLRDKVIQLIFEIMRKHLKST